MTPDQALERVKAAVGKEVALEMYADPGRTREDGREPGFRFVSWDGKWLSATRQDLKSLVEEIENEHRPSNCPRTRSAP